MCGLIGVLGGDVSACRGWDAAMRLIRRRGPDGSGAWISPSRQVRFGHTRLAVRDLSDAGSQPMIGEDDASALIYNGELYNADEIRESLEEEGCRFRGRCDTEVLLRGLIAWGADRMLATAVGIFAFAFWDDRRRDLIAAVDHAGAKPLVWHGDSERVVLASDCDAARALLEGDGISLRLDPLGLQSVLSFGYCPAPATVWAGLCKLEPGTLLRWKPGRHPSIERWWTPPVPVGASSACERDTDPRSSGRNGAEIETDPDWFSEYWPGVIGRESVSDRPIGVFLSSGLDSVAVASGLSASGVLPRCLTVSMRADDESVRAQKIAERLGLSHRVVAMQSGDLTEEIERAGPVYDEPQGFSALLSQRVLCEAARGDRAVMLSGDGGDEAFAGYAWNQPNEIDAMRDFTRRDRLRADATSLASAVAAPDADDLARRRALGSMGTSGLPAAWRLRVFPGFHPAEAAALMPDLARVRAGDTHRELDERATRADRPDLGDLDRVRRLDLALFCGGSILPKVDRASSWYGLEVRAPFLHRPLLEASLSRSNQRAGKDDLRRYLDGRGLLECTNPTKQGFSVRGWGITDWRRASDRINSSRLVRSGLLRPDWDRYIPRGDHLEQLRLQVLCMVAAWAETRL